MVCGACEYSNATKQVRAKALRRLAIAQLGSKGTITPAKWTKAIKAYIRENHPSTIKDRSVRAENIAILENDLKQARKGLPYNVELMDYYPGGIEYDDYYDHDILNVFEIDSIEAAEKICEDLVQILIKLKSPGTKYLYLTEKAKPKKRKAKAVKKVSRKKRATKR